MQKLAEGKFGAYMNISLENDGPVTISFGVRKRTAKTLS